MTSQREQSGESTCYKRDRMYRLAAVAFSLLSVVGRLGAQDKSLEIVHQIKTEAFDHSKVMDHLSFLTDVYGPRLTGSPEFEQAAEWAMSRLKQFGISNVHEEKWGPFGRSWSLQTYTLEMVTPRYSHLLAVPLAWSASSNGVEVSSAVFAPFHEENPFGVNKNKEALERYKAEWKGKLKGKIVLASEAKMPKPSTHPVFQRYTHAELANIAKAPTPVVRRNTSIDELKIPEDEDEAEKYFSSLSGPTIDELLDRYFALATDMARFFHDEGALGVIRTDERAHNGLLVGEEAGSHLSKDPLAPPSFVLTEEQYSRLAHLMEQKQNVTLRMNLEAKISDKDVDGANILGEIPGQKKPDEVVMIGAHFDSWHTGTGATDNGAGSAVMMEAMRILKTLNLPMDRTVRIGLWGGEEQGLYGSKAYVEAHFGDPKTLQVKPEHQKFDAYLNLDNGSGKIRGIYLENNDAARPRFEHWLAPFQDLGVTTFTLKHTDFTDHVSFDNVGLPGFQFIQDPLDYDTVTHHSDMDTYVHAIPEDLMQASAVIATLVYDLANDDEALPRTMVVRDGKVVR